MPNVNDLKSSKFLTKNDVGTGVVVTIKSYEKVNVAMESQAPEEKWVLSFHELPKPLVLNSTNGQLIAMITGSEDFDDWLEKKIILYNDPTVGFAGRITGGIRVKSVGETQGSLTTEQKKGYDGASGQRPLSREAEAESADRFAEEQGLEVDDEPPIDMNVDQNGNPL